MGEDIYFWSDTHFGHARLLELNFRTGFTTIEEHDQALLERWNACVGKGDRAYILGDFSFKNATATAEMLRQMNGRKFVVFGNHDHALQSALRKDPTLVEAAYDYKEITVEKQRLVLFHFPIHSWHQVHRGSWHLHGHSHNNLPPTEMARLDVGVDAFPNGPVSYDKVAEILKDKTGMPDEHHNTYEL